MTDTTLGMKWHYGLTAPRFGTHSAASRRREEMNERLAETTKKVLNSIVETGISADKLYEHFQQMSTSLDDPIGFAIPSSARVFQPSWHDRRATISNIDMAISGSNIEMAVLDEVADIKPLEEPEKDPHPLEGTW